MVFSVVFLSLTYDDILHANLLIYDLKKKQIERFEPYGKSNDYFIDDILEEELTWNTGFKYIKTSNYIPYTGFQTLSNENNINNLKTGDIGGFCLAWCLWYIESKLINPTVPSNILINKLIKKLNNIDINFNEYIRIYSNTINKIRIKYLLKIGIDKNDISNIYLSNDNYNKIIQFLLDIYN